MLLCDIGNTSYHFLEDDKTFKKDVTSFNPATITQRVYYISVNHEVNEKLKNLDNWIDLSHYVVWDRYYVTMGVDRIFAIEAVENGVIVDAGSAVTVDVVKNGLFQGGLIYPGVVAMQDTYKNISPALNYSFDFNITLDKMPKSSKDAISYGYLKLLYNEVISYELPIIITGGHAEKFAEIFKERDVYIEELLIFKGMKKIIENIENRGGIT